MHTPSPAILAQLPAAQTVVAIATYNERRSLPSLVETIRHILPEVYILIVDDNSPDGTGEWCREWMQHDARLLLHERVGKLGLGTALMTAMQIAVERGFRYMVTMDADHSHPVALLPLMLAMAENIGMESPSERVDTRDSKSYGLESTLPDVVIGSRYCRGGAIQGWPVKRYLMSWAINHYSRWFLRLPVYDCSGGYRCYRVSQLPPILSRPLLSQGYSFEEEVLWRLHCCGAKMVELPILFVNRIHGSSKLHVGGIFTAVRILLRLTWSNLCGGFRPAARLSNDEKRVQ
ncbi:MAG: polyprenol monophosphomannose synthase [Thermoguttaceae bacterium]|nr:polyprenol monophosphomannose synthase [Thermoguttaceae bacterium]